MMWVDVPQISLLSFFFLSEASRQYKKKTLPGTEPSGQVFQVGSPSTLPTLRSR